VRLKILRVGRCTPSTGETGLWFLNAHVAYSGG
jgi:hypothetical protein